MHKDKVHSGPEQCIMNVVGMLSTTHSTPQHNMQKEPWYQLNRGLYRTQQSGHTGKGKNYLCQEPKPSPSPSMNDSKSNDSYKRRTVDSNINKNRPTLI